MTKSCPVCQAPAPPGARYCRHCGALLQRAGMSGVSPIAATVPLSGQNTTDEIVANPMPQFAASHTAEVTREEMSELLHEAPPENGKKENVRRANERRSSTAHSAPDAPRLNTADELQAGAVHSSAEDSDDPEETQITIPVRPLTARNLPADAALAAPSNNTMPEFNAAPRQVTPSPAASLQPGASAAIVAPLVTPSTEARAFRVWLGLGGLSVIVICGVIGALWFNSRQPQQQQQGHTPTAAVAPPAAPGESASAFSDPAQLANAKLAEAEALLVSGKASEAMERLHEAARLDPGNAEPHRRLARLLLASGAQRESIEEFRAVTRLDANDAQAWRSLAVAQFAEGRYADAVETYRGFGEAQPAAFAQDAVQLSYADALRLAGRNAQARSIYRRLASSSDAKIAGASQRHIGLPPPAAEDEAQPDEDMKRAETHGETSRQPATSPTLAPAVPIFSVPRDGNETLARPNALSPAEHYQRGVGLWTTNRAAAVAEFRAAAERGNSEASYYLGLSLAEGRDPRALKRADLVAALVHFGRARKSRFRAPAATYEEQLGRELDRRRNQQSNDK
ncbi:MAG: tetratricopeptide repeat protein [Pyrinomonadaceae bacterium]